MLKKSGIKKEEGNWLQKNFLGTEWSRTRGQIRAAAAAVNKPDMYQHDFKKNSGFEYDPIKNTVSFANSAQGAEAYLRFMRKLEDFSTFSNGTRPSGTQKFLDVGVPVMMGQFGQTLKSELVKIGQNQDRLNSDPALKFILAMDAVSQYTGMLAPIAGVRGSRPVVTKLKISNTRIRQNLSDRMLSRQARSQLTALRQNDFMNSVDSSTLDSTDKIFARRMYNPKKSYAENRRALDKFIVASTKKNAFIENARKSLKQIEGFDYDRADRDGRKIFDIYDPSKTIEQNMENVKIIFAEKIQINEAIAALKLNKNDLEVVKNIYNQLNIDSPYHYYDNNIHNRFLKFIAQTPQNDPSFSVLGLIQYIKTVKYDNWDRFLSGRGF